jgi:hypothetical protein
MSPFIRDGDVITISPVLLLDRRPSAIVPSVLASAGSSSVGTCGIGHVVAFISPASERLVVHRIIGRRGEIFQIQGDSAQGPATEAVEAADVLGRVVRIERGGKRVCLGLGPERYALVLLSKVGLLPPIVAAAGTLVHFLRRRRDNRY